MGADSPDVDAFLAAILGAYDSVSVAAVAAEILYEYDPNQPRDERGRWTAGGSGVSSSTESPPNGTKENGYAGLGTWTLSSEQQAIDFFSDLLKADQNNLPDEWVRVLKDGCKGLTLLRIGWQGKPPPNALFLKDVEYFATPGAAEKELATLTDAHPEKTYLLFAAQLPTKGNGEQIARRLGDGPLQLMGMTGKLSLDMDRIADFNFATWFPTRVGNGYWEYMNHHWRTFDPNDLPAVKHRRELPYLGLEFLIIYGIVERRIWKRRR